MIRLLTEADRVRVLSFLNQEPSYNIFPIGDIETFGFDTDFQRVYGEFDEDEDFLSILLRYREHAIYYAPTERFSREYLPIFEDDPFEHISGKTRLMMLVKPHLEGFTERREQFCEATELRAPVAYDETIVKTVRTKEECGKLYDLLATIPEFGIHKKPKQAYIEGKYESLKMGTTLYIEQDGKFVSTVATTAETSINAMVVAVATHADYRNNGYASALMTHLMKLYLEDKDKDLCLFYDNDAAGQIYLRLGFDYIGAWSLFDKTDE